MDEVTRRDALKLAAAAGAAAMGASAATAADDQRAKPKPTPPKRSWIEINGIVHCFRDPDNLCIVSRFLEPKSMTAFHDKELAECTKELNSLLSKAQDNNRDRRRELAILKTEEGLLLAWVQHAAHGPNDPETGKALGLE